MDGWTELSQKSETHTFDDNAVSRKSWTIKSAVLQHLLKSTAVKRGILDTL